MRSFKRVMCSFGGEEEYRRKVASSLPVSPQDDHVIEFAKQFGWDSTWLDKQQPKKKGKRAEQAAARSSGDVGEMLAFRAGSRETTSQVVPHEQPDAAPVAPQVPAAPVAPPVKAAPLAPPSSSAVPIEAPALPATPAAHVMTPPPSRRRARSGSRDSGRSRLAVIARTAQSKAMPRPDSFVADIEAELEAEQSRGAQGEESHGAEGEESHGAEGEESRGAQEESHSHPTCVICFEPCNPNDAQYPLEALPCAHVFHVECLRAWRETVRITDRARCPNGCHRAHVHPFFRPHVQPSSSSRDDRAHFGNGGDAVSVAAGDDGEVSPMSPGDVAFL